MHPQALMIGSVALLLALGLLHVGMTLAGHKLTPRDSALQERMSQVSPVITDETTMWKVWIGVNVTHSMALILFALVYGYLAVTNDVLLFGSPFLLGVGAIFIGAFVALGKIYFFSVPMWGLIVALLLYLASIGASRA